MDVKHRSPTATPAFAVTTLILGLVGSSSHGMHQEGPAARPGQALDFASPQTPEELRHARRISAHSVKEWAEPASEEERLFDVGHISLIPVDLNDDGKLDLLFLTYGSCGSLGCLIEVSLQETERWRSIRFCDIVQVVFGVQVLPHKTNGLHDLAADGHVFFFRNGEYCERRGQP